MDQHQAVIEGVALLVVDMQEGFLAAIPNRAELIRRCEFAIKAADLLGLPVVFTEQVPEKLGATLPQLLKASRAPTVFSKVAFNAFGAPGLEAWLDRNEISHLLLAGIETPICVYQTAIEAHRRELPVTLLSDCIGARRDADAATIFQFLRHRTTHAVLPAEALYYSLIETAAHPQFRAYTQLVKQAANS